MATKIENININLSKEIANKELIIGREIYWNSTTNEAVVSFPITCKYGPTYFTLDSNNVKNGIYSQMPIQDSTFIVPDSVIYELFTKQITVDGNTVAFGEWLSAQIDSIIDQHIDGNI